MTHTGETSRTMANDTENTQDWDYPSITERRLHTGPLIQRIGSFYPKKRKGYSDSRLEQRIQKRTARLLYDKRITIARSIAHSPYTKVDEVLNDALVTSGIAPNSVEGWKDYIILIAEREGGWDIFRNKLETHIYYLDYYQKSMVVGWAVSLLACLLSFSSQLMFSPLLGDSWASTLVYGLILGLGVFVVATNGLLRSREARPAIKKLTGPPARDTSSFVTAEKIHGMS